MKKRRLAKKFQNKKTIITFTHTQSPMENHRAFSIA